MSWILIVLVLLILLAISWIMRNRNHTKEFVLIKRYNSSTNNCLNKFGDKNIKNITRDDIEDTIDITNTPVVKSIPDSIEGEPNLTIL